MEFLASQPYQQYGGQRIANLTGDQQTAMQYGRNIANMSSNPIPVMDAARDQANSTLRGDYLAGGSNANPYASMQNRYLGESPQFQSLLQSGLADIASTYHQATNANLDRFKGANRNSSAYRQATQESEDAFAKRMGDFSAGMLNDQFNRSAQLEESGLNRGMTAFENERQRQMGAIGAGQAEQGLAFERMRNLMGIGDANRAYNQDLLNLDFSNWQQAVQHPYTMMDWQTGIYSRAQGGMSPNSSFSQSGYAASPFSQLLGGAMLGYGLLGG
jgi:hypothetical protein